MERQYNDHKIVVGLMELLFLTGWLHDYDGINWTLIADVVFDDMGPFVEQIKDILAE